MIGPDTGASGSDPEAAPGFLVSVEMEGGRLRWRLGPDGPGHPPPTLDISYFVPPDTLADLRGRVSAFLRSGERRDTPDSARALGQRLHKALLPPAVAERLSENAESLTIRTGPDHPPWEMLHDGEAFWGLRHAIGRVAHHGPPGAPRLRNALGFPRVLLIGSDPAGALPYVEAEMRGLETFFRNFATLTTLRGARATAITDALAQYWDIVHVSAAATPVGEILVAGDTPMSVAAFAGALVGNPLVVLHLADHERGAKSGRDPGSTGGSILGPRLVERGALGVVGTLSPAGTRHDVLVARRFYQHALEGDTLGEALRRARTEARLDPAAARTPTWLATVLHGHPRSLLVCSEPVRQAVRRQRNLTIALSQNGRRRTIAARHGTTAAEWLWRLGAVAALLAVGMVARPMLAPLVGPERVEIVMADEVLDPAARGVMREVLGSLQDGLAAVAAARPDAVRLLPPSAALCQARSLGACAPLDAHHADLRVVVTPLRGPGAALGLRAHGIDRWGTTVFERHVIEPFDAPDRTRGDLLAEVLRGMSIRVEPTLSGRLFPGPESARQYRLLRASLDGSVMQPIDPGAAWSPRGRSLRLRAPWGGGAAPRADGGTEITAFLEAHAVALARHDVAALAAQQPSMAREQRAALEVYLTSVRPIGVRFTDVDLTVHGGRALVSAWRHDRLDPLGSTPRELAVHVTLVLERGAEGWSIQDQQGQAHRWKRLGRRLRRMGKPHPTPPAPSPPITRTVAVPEPLPDHRGTLLDVWSGTGLPWHVEGTIHGLDHWRNGGGEHGLHLRAYPGSRLERALPEPAMVPHAEAVRVRVRATTAPAAFDIVFSGAAQPGRFWRTITLEDTEWHDVTLPLRYFRWSSPAVPVWEQIDRVAVEFGRGAHVALDHVGLLDGRWARAAYLSPEEIERIAFGEHPALPVRRFDYAPFAVLTNSHRVHFATWQAALEATYRRVVTEFPYLEKPNRRVVLVVFATESEHGHFWPRLMEHFGGSCDVAPEVAGMAAMGIGATFVSERFPLLPVAVHEATHALTTQMLRIAGGRTWLSEGLATRYEILVTAPNPTAEMRQRLGAYPIPALHTLLDGSPIASHGYMPSALVIQWLLDDALRRMQLPQVLRAMQEDGTSDARPHLTRHLGLGLADLEDSWREWLASTFIPQ